MTKESNQEALSVESTAPAQGPRLSARERIAALVDPDSLSEQFSATTPAVITGTATVGGRLVAVLANDPTAPSGSSPLMVEKTLRLQETAERLQCPVIYLFDASPPNIRNVPMVFAQRDGVGRAFYNYARMSGRVPQIAALFGTVSSAKSFPAALCDVLVMVEGTTLSLSTAEVTAQMTGTPFANADVNAHMHASVSGTADAVVPTDADAIAWVRRYLGYMPQNAGERTELARPEPPALTLPLADLIPRDPGRPFPMKSLIGGLIDRGTFFETKERFAEELITAYAFLEGVPIAIVANNSARRGGVLHAESCEKAVRFIQSCDAYNLPLLFLIDVPGFMVGAKAERNGIVRQAAKFLMATATATVPKLSVLVRKAHSAGLFAMCGPAFSPDAFFALPDTALSLSGKKLVDIAVRENSILPTLHGAERDRYEAEMRMSQLSHTDPRLLARELVIDAIVPGDCLRDRLGRELRRLRGARTRAPSSNSHPIWPI